MALPNVLPQHVLDRMPSWLPHNQVSLGLDLRGGSHLVLEVDESELTKERAAVTAAGRPPRAARKGHCHKLGGPQPEPDHRDAADPRSAMLPLPNSRRSPTRSASAYSAGQSDLDVTCERREHHHDGILRGRHHANVTLAVEQSLEIIRQRVDQVGVAEPTIQRVGADRILVQLPGVQDPIAPAPAPRLDRQDDASTCCAPSNASGARRDMLNGR